MWDWVLLLILSMEMYEKIWMVKGTGSNKGTAISRTWKEFMHSFQCIRSPNFSDAFVLDIASNR